MLDKLGSALKKTLSKIAGAVFVDNSLIDQICEELKRSMLEADIPLDIIQGLIEKIKEQSKKDQKGIEKREQLLKLIHDELTNIIGKGEKKIKPDKKAKPYIIMLAGLYGAGKTTAAAKLALYYSKRGFKTCVLGLDVHRPAAPEQLQQMAEKAKVTSLIDKDEKNVLAIYEKYKSKIKKFDLCIVDTAGRDALSKDLIDEITLLKKEIKPRQTFLVIAADIGQTARKQAKTFNEVGITGVIVTRLDGTAKGGGALASCTETGANVVFIGTGEKVQDIETFDPSGFVSRLLGMGDLKALLEKVKTVAEEQQQEQVERIKKGKLTLTDFCDQIKTMQKMGPMDKIAGMVPGLGNLGKMGGVSKKIPEMFGAQEEKIKRWKFAIDSMTKKEKEDPDVLDSSRITRVSKGSHVPTNEIREMIKQYKLVKEFSSTKNQKMDQRMMQKIAKKFGKKLF
ncbi:MAG: signal recognition particle protein [archaeon]|nr:MAG: signal recognition particle protein [archaeon]